MGPEAAVELEAYRGWIESRPPLRKKEPLGLRKQIEEMLVVAQLSEAAEGRELDLTRETQLADIPEALSSTPNSAATSANFPASFRYRLLRPKSLAT